jgi:hypothetical protein
MQGFGGPDAPEGAYACTRVALEYLPDDKMPRTKGILARF